MNTYGIVKNRWIVSRFTSLDLAEKTLAYRQSIEKVKARAGKIIVLDDNNREPKRGVNPLSIKTGNTPF